MSDIPLAPLGLAAAAIVVLVGLWFELERRHRQVLRRLVAGLSVMADQPDRPWRPPADLEAEGGEIGALVKALERLSQRLCQKSPGVDGPLDAVLASIAEGIVVITPDGQVSLANAAGAKLLGKDAVVGTSVLDTLDRHRLTVAMHAADREGRALRQALLTVAGDEIAAHVAPLARHRGYVLSFAGDLDTWRHHIEHDLGLHEPPDPMVRPRDQTPLEALPALALDLETTGLDPATDRALAVGAIAALGGRLLRSRTIDRLIDPGGPVPARSTAVHGITGDMVAGQPSFAALWPDIERLMRNRLLIGHNIGFDLAVLRHETARAGIAFTAPDALCTMRLYAALEPKQTALDLDRVAEALGVEVTGRHTAFGDALVTAEVWVRLIPLLHARGIRTLAEATAFASSARRVVELQRQAGW